MSRTYYKKFDKSFPITDKKFQKILSFYLFECPTPNKSQRATTFEQLGWRGRAAFSSLRKKILASSSLSLKENYYPCSKDELEQKFKLVSEIKPVDEYCVFLKSDEKSVMQSLFSAIRNAFAHGSFDVRYYHLENGEKKRIYFFSNYDKYLKAELVLQEQTLINWIDIVKSGYNPNL